MIHSNGAQVTFHRRAEHHCSSSHSRTAPAASHESSYFFPSVLLFCLLFRRKVDTGSPGVLPVKKTPGEPGHTWDTRTHKGTRTTQTNLTTIQTHQQHTTRTSARRPKVRSRGRLKSRRPGVDRPPRPTQKRPPPANPTLPPPAPRAPPRACSKAVGEMKAIGTNPLCSFDFDGELEWSPFSLLFLFC